MSATDSPAIPLLRPVLPDLAALHPFLQRIDVASCYTNFGPLHDQLLHQLIELQNIKSNSKNYGVLTSNATIGLELAIASLELPLGSRIAVPALTFPATVTAVLRSGHLPVVMDIDHETWLLTPNQVTEAVQTQKIKAVIPVASFGMPQNVFAWKKWMATNKVAVIIDAAAAFGAQATCEGITTVFSFHATKPLSCGEGGMIVTADSELAARLRQMTNFGIGANSPTSATNAKLSEYHAAVGLAHLKFWETQNMQRMALLNSYKERLDTLSPERIQFQGDTGLVAPCVFPIKLSSEEIRTRVELACNKAKIQTRRWYLPLVHKLSIFEGKIKSNPTPNADLLEKTLLGLPFFINMTKRNVDSVSDLVLFS